MKEPPKRTVLVVDDDGDLRQVLRLALADVAGVTVLEAASGEEALRAVQRVLPDAILLDMKMPGMGGPATLFALQSDSHTAHIPVVFVTANPEPVDVQQLRAQGAVGVLTKPFRPAHLVAELARMLGWP